MVVSHARSSLELTRYDLSTLRPGEWLNDECMNMYMALLQVCAYACVCVHGWDVGCGCNQNVLHGNRQSTCG